MRTEPTGVKQNYAPPGSPPDLRPVAQDNWKMFAKLDDAKKGLQMIHKVAPDAVMFNAEDGLFSQFIYDSADSDIRARVASGKAGNLAILEFPSDILDRHDNPRIFIDTYPKAKDPVLKCRNVSPTDGELYWSDK